MKEIVYIIKTQGADKAKKSIDNVKKSAADLDKSSKKGSTGLLNLEQTMNSLSGPAKSVANGFNLVKQSMMALLANPIGLVITAIVVAFVALKKALTSTEEGQNKLSKAMGVLSTIFSKFFDLLEPIASFLFDVVVSAFEAVGEVVDSVAKGIESALSFLGLGDSAEGLKEYREEMKRVAEASAKVADMRAEAEKKERDLIVEKAEIEAKIAENREKASDRENFTAEERKKFLIESNKLADELAAKEEEKARLIYEAIKLENSLTNSTIEDKKAEAEAEAELIRIRTRRAELKRRLGKEEEAINNEIIANEKANNKKRLELIEKEREAKRAAYEEELKRQKEKQELEDKQFELMNELTLSEKDLKIQRLIEQYEKKFEIANGNAELEKKLQEKLQEEITQIENGYEEKRKQKLISDIEKNTAIKIEGLQNEIKQLTEINDINFYTRLEKEQEQYERNREIIEQQRQTELEELNQLLENKLITEEEFNKRKLDLENSYNKKIEENTVKHNEFIKNENDKVNQAKIIGATKTFEGLKNISSSLEQLGVKSVGLNKTLALADVAINTAKSISNVIAGATAAAAAGGPAAPFLLAGYISSGIATVLSAVASADRILNTTPTPSGGGATSSVSTPSTTSFSAEQPESVTPNVQTLFSTEDLEGSESINEGSGAGLRQQVIRAYVVESDITDTQSNLSDLKQRSEIG